MASYVKLAVVGSTSLVDHPVARDIIETAIRIYNADAIVSGGAPGIDSLAEKICKELGLEPRIYRPTVRRWHGEGGFKCRNILIANDCDRLVRIVSSKSKTYGSGFTRDLAVRLGKPTETYVIQEE